MQLDKYYYLEVDEPKEEIKQITRVRFEADYDITDVLTRWGNWARKEAYLQRKSFTLFKSEFKDKELLNNDDGITIDSVIAELGKMKSKKAKNEYQILKLYYFGKVNIVDNNLMIMPQSLRSIAKMMNIGATEVRAIKNSAESCIVGMLSMLTMLTGKELELLKNINLLK